MAALDTLWPDADIAGPRKVHVVELIDAIKLRLCDRARKNGERYESPFERVARKATGVGPRKEPEPSKPLESQGKTALQLAHEEAKARMRR